jgi:hypothetical protein
LTGVAFGLGKATGDRGFHSNGPGLLLPNGLRFTRRALTGSRGSWEATTMKALTWVTLSSQVMMERAARFVTRTPRDVGFSHQETTQFRKGEKTIRKRQHIFTVLNSDW